LTYFDPRRETSQASRCRIQAEEYHRLMLQAQSGAEATILTSLMRSWKMIANQTDRYVAIMKKDAAQKNRPASVRERPHGVDRINIGPR
jgi:hypothetical protein